MHPQLVSPLLEVKQVTKTGEGGERKSGRDSELSLLGKLPYKYYGVHRAPQRCRYSLSCPIIGA